MCSLNVPERREGLLKKEEIISCLEEAISASSAAHRASLLRRLQGEFFLQLLAETVSPEYVDFLRQQALPLTERPPT